MTKPKPKTETHLIAKYNGPTQHTRIIEAKQFNKDFFSSQEKDLVWEESNRWTVDVTDASPEMIDYLRNTDPDFTVREQEVLPDEGEHPEDTDVPA